MGNIIIKNKSVDILLDTGLETLRNADLRNADLRNADLRNADLWNADLRNADLRDADLQGADLWNADLRNANLQDANLQGADLRNADLQGANLWDADLQGANLRNADLWNANLQDANLQDAKINNCVGNGKEIKTIFIGDWPIVFTVSVLAIGCRQHTIEDWQNFDDGTIAEMNGKALIWWRKWKDHIFKTIELANGARRHG